MNRITQRRRNSTKSLQNYDSHEETQECTKRDSRNVLFRAFWCLFVALLEISSQAAEHWIASSIGLLFATLSTT